MIKNINLLILALFVLAVVSGRNNSNSLNNNEYSAAVKKVVAKKEITKKKSKDPVPGYLKKFAEAIKCQTGKECTDAIIKMAKENVEKLSELLNKFVPADKIPKELKDLIKKLKSLKVITAKKTVSQPPLAQPAPAKVSEPLKNPCPTIDDVQWQPIPSLPAPTKICFGKKKSGDITYDFVISSGKSPALPQYYFKTSLPDCPDGQQAAIKKDASGIECAVPGEGVFTFTYNYCPIGDIMIPRPEKGDKPTHCLGLIEELNTFAMWPYNADASGYAGRPETELGKNIRCDASREDRVLTDNGKDIICQFKGEAKDLLDPNDKKTEFKGYKLPSRYSMIYPMPNLGGSGPEHLDQGDAASRCARSYTYEYDTTKYGSAKKPTFSKLKSQICKFG